MIHALTKSAGQAWCIEEGFDFDPRAVGDATEHDQLYGIPSDSGPKAELSRQIASACVLPALLWIEHPSVWPSAEQLSLFYMVRAAMGERRELQATPAHVFEANDRGGLSAFLAMVLYFYWQAELLEVDNSRSWGFNHDEFLFFRSDDKNLHREALALVQRFGLKEW